MVGPDRRLAVIRTTLDEVKAVAHAHGATVNDVLLALTAGGLRTLLRSRGTDRGHHVADLRPRLVASARRRAAAGQPVAQMAVPLAMRESDAGDELRRIDSGGRRGGRRGRERRSGRSSEADSRLMLFGVMHQRVNVTTASIPGPEVPLYLCARKCWCSRYCR